MTCRDFERLWNERLDGSATAGLEASLAEHAAGCPGCGAIGPGFQSLDQALRHWGPPPSPPPEFADRFLARSDLSATGSTLRFVAPRGARRWAIAAALLALAWAGSRAIGPGPKPGPERIAAVEVDDPPPFDRALVQATSATWELARLASGPAARIGREVLDATAADLGASTALPSPASASNASTPEVWRQVGDRLGAGVEPFEGSARGAFGFLLGPALAAEPVEPGT